MKVFWIAFIPLLALPAGAVSSEGFTIIIGYAGFLIAGAFLASSVIVASSVPTSFSVLRINELMRDLESFLAGANRVLIVSISAAAATFVATFDLPTVDTSAWTITLPAWLEAQIAEVPTVFFQALSLALLIVATDRVRIVIKTLSTILSVSGVIAKSEAEKRLKGSAPNRDQVREMFPTSETFGQRPSGRP